MSLFKGKSKKVRSKYIRLFISAILSIMCVGVGAVTYAYNVTTEVSPSRMGIHLMTPSGHEETTGMKKGEDGTYAYCLDPQKGSPANTEYTKGDRTITDTQYAILGWCYPSYRYTGCDEVDYFISQVAVWHNFADNFDWTQSSIVMDRDFKIGESGYTPDYSRFTGRVGESLTEEDIRAAIDSLCRSSARAQQAYYAMSPAESTATPSDDADGDYVTTPLSITKGNNAWTGNESFKVSFTENNYGATFVKQDGTKGTEITVTSGDKFSVRVPKDKIDADGQVKYQFSGNVSGWVAGNYNPVSDGSKQPLALIWKDTLNATNTGTVKWGKLPTETKGSVKIKKVDDSYNVLEGAVFEMKGDGYKEKATTNSKGIATWENVKPGKYTVKETEAPDGYDLSDEEFKVTVVAEDTDTISAGTCIDKKIPQKKTPEVKKGSLKLTKVDEETNAPLKGATFEVWDKDQKNKIDSQTTDDTGLATFTLPVGQYFYKEVQAPEGYNLNGQWNELNIADTSTGLSQAFKVTNKKPGKVTYSMELTKKDISTGTPLPNAGFTIYGSDQTTVITSGITDNNGICKFVLDKGVYYYQETLAPVGYKINSEKFKFEITDADKNIKCTMSDELDTPTKSNTPGGIDITKVDVSTGKPLPNATFNIYAEDQKTLIASGSTDETGIARFENLPMGTYYYQEFSAPDGYEVDNTKFPFSIKEKGQIVKCQMTDVPKEVVLPKTGDITNDGMPLVSKIFFIMGGIMLAVTGRFYMKTR